jgi:glycosyltransferase involved in cell wall biosynthesis
MEKIALVISSLSSGGGERVVATLSQEFAKNYDVTIILFDSANIDYEYGGEILDINCPDKPSFLGKTYNLLKRAYKLKNIFKQQKFDHIFGFMESANYPSILASRQTIASLHIDYNFLNPTERCLVRHIYPLAKAVAPVSDDIASTLTRQLSLDNVSRIYNPVPFEELENLANEPFQHPRKFLIAVGRLTYQKHFDLMINAFAESKAQKNCDLIILGEGELRTDLEQQIKHLKLEDKVHLPGRLKNPFKYMKHAEFMLLSSRAEGFPMVLIEGLSLNCPAVATDCPTGPREIIQKDVNGFLINTEDKPALINSIDTLFHNEELRSKFSHNAQGSVNHLAVKNICKEWIALSQR